MAQRSDPWAETSWDPTPGLRARLKPTSRHPWASLGSPLGLGALRKSSSENLSEKEHRDGVLFLYPEIGSYRVLDPKSVEGLPWDLVHGASGENDEGFEALARALFAAGGHGDTVSILSGGGIVWGNLVVVGWIDDADKWTFAILKVRSVKDLRGEYGDVVWRARKVGDGVEFTEIKWAKQRDLFGPEAKEDLADDKQRAVLALFGISV